jgi:precorrin-6A/cobalt-precorrin-6A reductase
MIESQASAMPYPPKILLLGGTADAMRMGEALAAAGIAAIYSVAGRTEAPKLPPLPHRMGGFGGVAGLAHHLKATGISHVIDATHPFAARMSHNAVQACAATELPLIALERAPWRAGPGDSWRHFKDLPALAAAFPKAPTRIFLAIGRQNLECFAAHPQHHYLLRLVDPPTSPPPLPNTQIEISRGPFTHEGDLALIRSHGTELVIAKNAGGEATRAKLTAAASLGLPVWLAERPIIAARESAGSVEEVLGWLAAHIARLGA